MNRYEQINTEESYTKLLNSGMFWEMHPQLIGKWEVDKKLIITGVGCSKNLEEKLLKKLSNLTKEKQKLVHFINYKSNLTSETILNNSKRIPLLNAKISVLRNLLHN
tara:strand:+ start:643 stop:963 length:321 start_codon:yes stop_codon:yes gene_type:complete